MGYDFEGNVVSSRIADFRNVNWGFLYKDELYTWYKKYLFKINIAKLTNETFSLYGLNKFRIENIVGVDKDQIYFNASNLNEQINKNNTFQKKYYLFSFNQNSGLLSQVDIATDLFRVTSVANGKFYYNDINKRVFEKSGEEITLLFPNGLSPTISPNGKYIAFYIKNLMVTKLLIYSLDKKQVLYKDRFIKHLEPDIRWSSDSRCVSFKEINLDVGDSYIYVVDITKGKYLLKLKKSAINWFLN